MRRRLAGPAAIQVLDVCQASFLHYLISPPRFSLQGFPSGLLKVGPARQGPTKDTPKSPPGPSLTDVHLLTGTGGLASSGRNHLQALSSHGS